MANGLLHYFEERFSGAVPVPKAGNRPFVTISRETGCNSITIAEKLIRKLNLVSDKHWKLVSKEILGMAAEKLNLDPHRLESVFNAVTPTQMDEILKAFSEKYYKSDKTIRKTVREIICDIARDGYVVIVGRAGVAITNDMPGGLHCRLHAPLEWRVKNIAGLRGLDEKTAKEYILDSDEKREKLLKDFSGKTLCDMHFDVGLNNQRLNDEQIADILFELMKMRGLIIVK
jgi:cytidylate kinase